MTAQLTVTMAVLMAGHIAEISVWASFYTWAGVETEKASPLGPITALNGLLLIGWSVAIIFEVMRMAELQIPGVGRDHVLRGVIRLTSLDRRRH